MHAKTGGLFTPVTCSGQRCLYCWALSRPPAPVHNKHHTHSLEKQLAAPTAAETKRPNTVLTQGQVSEPAGFRFADAENQRWCKKNTPQKLE